MRLKLPCISVVDQAIKVIKWFNNHSRVLRLLKQCMLKKLCKVYVLILPVITQWMSHYLSCKHLLLVVCTVDRWELKEKANRPKPKPLTLPGSKQQLALNTLKRDANSNPRFDSVGLVSTILQRPCQGKGTLTDDWRSPGYDSAKVFIPVLIFWL